MLQGDVPKLTQVGVRFNCGSGFVRLGRVAVQPLYFSPQPDVDGRAPSCP